MLNLRMCELCITEHALGNSDIIATKKGLIAGAAGGLGTGMNGTANGFACGGIERIKADGTGHVCSNTLDIEALKEKAFEKKKNQFF